MNPLTISPTAGMIPSMATTDGGGVAPAASGGAPGPSPANFAAMRNPLYQMQQASAQIQQLEKQLMDMQRTYGMMALKTNNPQQLFAMQSAMNELQQKISMAKNSAQQQGAMAALKARQGAMGRKSPGINGGGGQPVQSGLDLAQQIQLLAGMFGSGGRGPEY